MPCSTLRRDASASGERRAQRVVRPRALLGGLGLALLAVACASADEEPDEIAHEPGAPPSAAAPAAPSTLDRLDRDEWNVAPTEAVEDGAAGEYVVAWRSVGGDVKRNTDLELEVLVLADGEPFEEAAVKCRGWMPDHSHGFVQVPVATALGGGRHRIAGVLLHMRGRWQLFFDVVVGNEGRVAAFELEV